LGSEFTGDLSVPTAEIVLDPPVDGALFLFLPLSQDFSRRPKYTSAGVFVFSAIGID
jgi:hypothetical protein